MFLRLISIVLITAFTTFSQEAPVGTSVQPSPKEKKALDSFKISYRKDRLVLIPNSKHDIWLMNADGTGITIDQK